MEILTAGEGGILEFRRGSFGETLGMLHRLIMAAIAAISAAAEIGNRGGVKLLIS